jgi:hypothetical protein
MVYTSQGPKFRSLVKHASPSIFAPAIISVRHWNLAIAENIYQAFKGQTYAAPSITNIYYMAETLTDGIAPSLLRSRAECALKSRSRGAAYYQGLGNLPSIDSFVYFSFAPALFVRSGQATYAAANGSLHAMA